jgi:Cu(I)/Ag(I) efflux system membrane fusion protein
MKNWKQIGIAISLVGAAALVVILRGGSDMTEAEAAMEGHDHAAMLAGLEEARAVQLPPELESRTGITFATAVRRDLARTVRALGRVEYDETRLSAVSPKLEGWAERLYVEFTGAPVRAGEPLLDIYSPTLVAAQEELILARRLAEEVEPGSVREENAQRLLESARRRLLYWDVPEDVVAAIEASGEVSRTVPLLSGASGVVVEKDVVEGGRVTPGTTLYRIADLSVVWLEADVFERDLSLVRVGAHATVSLEAYPGEAFHGMVTYVYPIVDQATRTGTVRVELANPELMLKPGMYASISLDAPGSVGALVVPRGALLLTGERTLVYVRRWDGTLEPREVVAGLAAGREIEILSGLEEGEVVVSSASFLVDAESNLGSVTGGAASTDPAMDEMDHSQHQMAPGPPSPDSAAGAMDHSQHGTDSAGGGGDHSGHGRP